MRVLLLTQYLALGGLEKMLVSLAHELSNQGVQCWVVSYEETGLHNPFLDELQRAGVKTITLQKQSGLCFKTIFSLRRIIRDNAIDVVHSHDLGALIYASLSKSYHPKIPKLVHTQHSFVHFRKGHRRYGIYEKLFARFADVICAVSESIRQQYRSLGISAKKIRIVPNGISFPATFVEQHQSRAIVLSSLPADISQRLRDASHKRWLVAVGRVVRGKGLERLLTLWKARSQRFRQEWCLFIVGPQDETFYSEILIPILNPHNEKAFNSSDLFFVGPTNNPFDWYFSADAFVSLSEYEGMPLAVCEAMASGLPLLLSDISGHQRQKNLAQFLPEKSQPNDAAVLSAFLERAPQSTDARLHQWTNLAAFRFDFGSASMAQHYLDVYRQTQMAPTQVKPRLILTLIFFTVLSFLMPSVFAESQQHITAVSEKPEYLRADDFSQSISLSLMPGESKLLTIKNGTYCGPLPRLAPNIQSNLLTIAWYRGRSIALIHPSYEGAEVRPYIDALIPLFERVDCTNATGRDWLFAEITIHPDAKPGIYNTEMMSEMIPGASFIEEDSQPAQPAQRWPLTLEILPFQLQAPWTLPLAAEFTPYFASLAHFGQSTNQEGAITRRYVESMVSHRVIPLKSWIRHPFKNPHERNNENFLLSRDPTPPLSYASSVLDALPPWTPVDVPRIDSSDPEERLNYWQRWQTFFDEESADEREMKLKKRMSLRPFVYLWDEPTQEDFVSLREMAKSLHQAAPSIASLVTIYPWPGLLKDVQIFAPLLQTLEREGKPNLGAENQLWSYVSCMSHGCGSLYSSGEPDFVIERNASYIRVWPWMAEHYELQRVLYYSVNNGWRKSPAVNPWNDLWDFSGNGDGTLFYPGRTGEFGLKEETPIPSLRLKLWRQASFDADYLALAKAKNPRCVAQLRDEFQLVENAYRWSRDSRQYDKARDGLVRCLSQAIAGMRGNRGSRLSSPSAAVKP